MRMTMRNIEARDLVTIKARSYGHTWDTKFLGFTGRGNKYSAQPAYNNFKEVKEAGMGATMAEVERGDDAWGEYGHKVYAVFQDVETQTVWTAYVYNGSFRLGSGADRFSMIKTA